MYPNIKTLRKIKLIENNKIPQSRNRLYHHLQIHPHLQKLRNLVKPQNYLKLKELRTKEI